MSYIQFTEYGTDGSILLLKTCLDHLNLFRSDLKDMPQVSIIAAVIKYLLDKPNFSTVLSESLMTVEFSESFLEKFASRLQLNLLEKITIGLALSDSDNVETRLSGKYEVSSYFGVMPNFYACA